MPEILTESFCERCGTRYTFESAAPRAARLKGMRVLSRGLKNFVLSDDSSLDEAMAAARSDNEREATSHQLDAFHKTFNFCMQCRQYTCANCWNDVDGRCLTCAPHLGHEILAAPFPDLEAGPAIDLRIAPNGNGSNGHPHAHDVGLDSLAWPTTDLIGEAEPTDEAIAPQDLAPAAVEPDPVSTTSPVDEPTQADPDPEIEDRAASAAAATARLLQAFRPGQSLDEALDAYERDQGEIAAEPEAAAVAAATDRVEPEAAEAVAAPEAAAPVVQPEAPPADRVEQPTWRITAPDQTESKTANEPADVPTPPATDTQWPSNPEWPTPGASAGLPFLGRPATPTGGMEALWAESAREVSTVPTSGPAGRGVDPKASGGVQPCISCGLSLSANARFCRRCGSRQD